MHFLPDSAMFARVSLSYFPQPTPSPPIPPTPMIAMTTSAAKNPATLTGQRAGLVCGVLFSVFLTHLTVFAIVPNGEIQAPQNLDAWLAIREPFGLVGMPNDCESVKLGSGIDAAATGVFVPCERPPSLGPIGSHGGGLGFCLGDSPLASEGGGGFADVCLVHVGDLGELEIDLDAVVAAGAPAGISIFRKDDTGRCGFANEAANDAGDRLTVIVKELQANLGDGRCDLVFPIFQVPSWDRPTISVQCVSLDLEGLELGGKRFEDSFQCFGGLRCGHAWKLPKRLGYARKVFDFANLFSENVEPCRRAKT